MSYISSNDNRFYVALEQSYGNSAAVATSNRIPAVKLTTKQQTEKVQRKDKTGSRTFVGNPGGLRKQTSFVLQTYMATWTDQTAAPTHGPLFQSCLGNPPLQSNGGTVASAANPSQIVFTAPHGLAPGQAVACGGEIRFVAAILDSQTVQLNAPLTVAPSTNSQTGPTATYHPATNLQSVTLFDYWNPATAVQRVLAGAAIDALTVKVNGDFHQFNFSGQARDLVDSSSFESGQCGLLSFPPEPVVDPLSYSIIPGHLGQVWLGGTPQRFLTLIDAEVFFSNNLVLRASEFGADLPSVIVPGQRTVSLSFSIYQQDDSATAGLYQAARQRSPISVMIQLGQQQGQLFGIYMKSVVIEVPGFDDSDKRQQWQFQSSRAQGSVDDEIFVAFG
jgi:hypothetical protein